MAVLTANGQRGDNGWLGLLNITQQQATISTIFSSLNIFYCL
jgi:hypothetical protein